MLNNKLHFWINFLTLGYYNDLMFKVSLYEREQ